MKKLLTLTALCALLTAPAMAVQKCINPYADIEPEDYSSGTIEWFAIFADYTMRGMATCANTPGTPGKLLPSLTHNTSNLEDNTVCWCRIVSPVLSYWRYDYDFKDVYKCMDYCASHCADMAVYNSEARLDLLSNYF
ncbi:MAG: hypothetical protein E7009_04370 [Alphaproteobacteria bacterium]|nr:hypothetical protein [Alphaproteobacteria bacterium]